MEKYFKREGCIWSHKVDKEIELWNLETNCHTIIPKNSCKNISYPVKSFGSNQFVCALHNGLAIGKETHYGPYNKITWTSVPLPLKKSNVFATLGGRYIICYQEEKKISKTKLSIYDNEMKKCSIFHNPPSEIVHILLFQEHYLLALCWVNKYTMGLYSFDLMDTEGDWKIEYFPIEYNFFIQDSPSSLLTMSNDMLKSFNLYRYEKIILKQYTPFIWANIAVLYKGRVWFEQKFSEAIMSYSLVSHKFFKKIKTYFFQEDEDQIDQRGVLIRLA